MRTVSKQRLGRFVEFTCATRRHSSVNPIGPRRIHCAGLSGPEAAGRDNAGEIVDGVAG